MKERTKLGLIAIGFAACWFLPVENARFLGALRESLALVRWYAREHVLLCLIPAFFIAGAISVFISQGAVMRYLGPKAKKIVAYPVAAVSGTILAVSYVGKRVGRPSLVLLAGLLYTLGRALSYFVVAFIAVKSLASVPAVSLFLQGRMNQLLGPILLVVGLVFALTFCPVSAALFFGSLLPLSVKFDSSVLLPGLYGVGTALPVVIVSAIIAFCRQPPRPGVQCPRQNRAVDAPPDRCRLHPRRRTPVWSIWSAFSDVARGKCR